MLWSGKSDCILSVLKLYLSFYLAKYQHFTSLLEIISVNFPNFFFLKRFK